MGGQAQNAHRGAVLAAALAGLLFGFDTAVISGVITPVTLAFGLSDAGKGLAVSAALFGTLVAALCAGIPGDRFGARAVLRWIGVAFVLSALGCAVSQGLTSFALFRFIGGLAIGGSSVLAPVFIAEVSPAERRGALVGLFQVSIVAGILAAYLSNALVGQVAGPEAWRWKLAVMTVPGAIFLAAMWVVPHSPRWLATRGRHDEARSVAERLGMGEWSAIAARIESERTGERLFQRRYLKPILLAFGIASFNQLSGINPILYYLNDIFAAAGFELAFGRSPVGRDRRDQPDRDAGGDDDHRPVGAADLAAGRRGGHLRGTGGGRGGLFDPRTPGAAAAAADPVHRLLRDLAGRGDLGLSLGNLPHRGPRARPGARQRDSLDLERSVELRLPGGRGAGGAGLALLVLRGCLRGAVPDRVALLPGDQARDPRRHGFGAGPGSCDTSTIRDAGRDELATQRPSGTVSSATTLMAFGAITVLFFAWGFITSLNDPVVTAVKGIFCLTDVRAQLAAFAFFIAYGVASFPAAVLLSRLKSIPTILIALGMMIAGCVLMLAAANLAVYELVLIGLFVLAAGITVLQVAANPLAAALGNPKYSHFRLTFSQTFNSLGTFIGPYLGAVLFLKNVETKGCATTAAARTASLAGIDVAYLWICGLLAALALFFVLVRRVVTQAAPPTSDAARLGMFAMIGDALSSRWALLGGAAIFLYVGAEVSIGTQMAFFLHSDQVWGLTDAPLALPLIGPIMSHGADGMVGISAQEAELAVALYWGGAMVGRAVGSVLLAVVRASWLLVAFTAIATAMCLYVFAEGGVDAGVVALCIGLFNSIMFPVIFTLTLERSSASEEATSGFLCTSIIGGALIPPLVGVVSGATHSYVTAFIVPAVCYALLCLFAIAAGKAKVLRAEGEMASVH